MKRILLFALCFLLFIVAYGCAQGDDISVPQSSVEQSEQSLSSSGDEALNGESDTTSESGDTSGESSESDYGASDDSSIPDESSDESSEHNENSGNTSAESSDNSSSNSEPSDDSSVPDESAPDTSTPDESSDTSDTESSQDPTDEPITPPDDTSNDTSNDTSDDTSDDPMTPPIDDPVDPPIDPPIDEPVTPPDEDDEINPKIPPNYDEDEDMTTIGDAELLSSGYILYNGAAYHGSTYKSDVAQSYADVYARYAQLFPDVRVSVVMPPQSSINIKNPLVSAMLSDQGEVLDKTEAHIYGGVNFVNLREIFESTKGEYCFFRSDYHWTQLGAYYAYSEFAKSVGLTPTALDDFEVKVVTENFIGRANETSGDNRVLSYKDTIYAFMPTKKHTMTVYNSRLEVDRVFNNAINLSRESYSCFINGDNAYTVINVPSNDQSKTALVIKESSGNAFVPFLTEHYGNIIVIDPRHINIDIKNIVEEQGVDDIIFHATSSTCGRYGYDSYYRALIGGA